MRWPRLLVGIVILAAPTTGRAAQDVMLQTQEGRIVTGIVDDATGIGALGTRVFRGRFFSSFVAADPGFYGLPTGSPQMPPGAAGFPSEHDIEFDILPMRIGRVKSNLFYWDGMGPGAAFVNSPGVRWRIVDSAAPSKTFLIPGNDEFIPGGLIDQSAEDTNPSDGIDTGRIHAHLALQLVADGTPPQGVYMIAWQARSAGFETSQPFLFVHRTSAMSDAIRDLAASWAEDHIDSLFGPDLPGDYNQDNVVDGGDYVFWRNRLGMRIELPNEDASFGEVDLADYAVWKLHYGASIGEGGGAGGTATLAPGGSSGIQWAVPEAASLFMACIGGAMTALSAKRQRPVRRGPG